MLTLDLKRLVGTCVENIKEIDWQCRCSKKETVGIEPVTDLGKNKCCLQETTKWVKSMTAVWMISFIKVEIEDGPISYIPAMGNDWNEEKRYGTFSLDGNIYSWNFRAES